MREAYQKIRQKSNNIDLTLRSSAKKFAVAEAIILMWAVASFDIFVFLVILVKLDAVTSEVRPTFIS